jgi:hypothetical protein
MLDAMVDTTETCGSMCGRIAEAPVAAADAVDLVRSVMPEVDVVP